MPNSTPAYEKLSQFELQFFRDNPDATPGQMRAAFEKTHGYARNRNHFSSARVDARRNGLPTYQPQRKNKFEYQAELPKFETEFFAENPDASPRQMRAAFADRFGFTFSERQFRNARKSARRSGLPTRVRPVDAVDENGITQRQDELLRIVAETILAKGRAGPKAMARAAKRPPRKPRLWGYWLRSSVVRLNLVSRNGTREA